ncbi:MAG TPA: DUF4349 domain-containing protein [Chloroflexia bacterium]|nr:DUF4349 domain-containing protein [Chloroflexia bacterium]
MVRSYLEKIRARATGVRTGIQRQGGQAETLSTRLGGKRRLALVVVFAVLACMVLSVAANMYRLRTAAPSAAFATHTNFGDPKTHLPYPAGEGNATTTESSAASHAYQAPQTGGADARDGQPTGGTGQNGQAAPQKQAWDRMIIRTATLQIKVKDVGSSLDKARELASTNGGFVSASDSHVEGDYTVATLTIQVPARQFDDIMTGLRKIATQPIGENVSSSDVTEEYTDLGSQLRNLQATETRISALMSKAEKIEDILTLDRELRQIQGEIEQVQGRLNYLGKRSEMSSITLTLYPEVAPVEQLKTTDEGWNPGRIVQQAWDASLEMLSGIATVAITVAVFMWWAVPLLLIAAWLALRPRRNTRPTSTPTPDAA